MRLPLILCLGLVAVTRFAAPTFADVVPSDVIATQGAVARLIEAHRLYDLGTQAHDPVLVFAAARLMQGVTLREVTRNVANAVTISAAPADPKPEEKPKKKKDKAPDPAKADPAKADPAKGDPSKADPSKPDPPKADPSKADPSKPDPAKADPTQAGAFSLQVPATVPDPAQSAPMPGNLDPHAMMETARGMLPDGEILRDAIASAETEVPPPGPVAVVTSLSQPPGSQTTFALAMAGQSYAEVGLLRLGPGHLTFLVTDALGNPICQDISASPATTCGFVPRISDRFLVTISNDSTVAAPYLLITE